MKVMALLLTVISLTACGDSEPPAAAQTPAAPTAQQGSDYAGQNTAIDAQAKVLNDAKKVGQQQIDASAERMKESGE
jgi:predicted small lipoprotein YifL